MKLLKTSAYLSLFVAGLTPCFTAAAIGKDIHGPICSWHLDPTTTMQIQWIEGVDAESESGKWYVGKSGFGYGDDDDATRLDMARKHRVLYLRKEFRLRALPTEAPISLFGGWTANLVRQVGGKSVEHQFDVRFEFGSRAPRASLRMDEGEPLAFSKLDTAGRSVELEYELELDGKRRKVFVDAAAEAGENEKLAGTWRTLDEAGVVLETGEWTAALTEPPAFGRGGGRRGNRGGGGRVGRGGGGRGEPNVKLVMRARYDDGFIAYLNGEEIVRANVQSGAGEAATGIVGHDADDREEFVVESDELVKLLQTGTNVLAIEGHNNAIDSSDFTLEPEFGYEAFGRYQTLVQRGEDWQYLLGDPQSDWKTSTAIEAVVRDSEVPLGTSTFVLGYGKRSDGIDHAVQAERRPFADTGNVIHSVLLSGLVPDTTYAFELQEKGISGRNIRRYFFRTAPTRLSRPVRFVNGGDMYGTRAKLDAMNSEAGQHEPMFALLGGDLAYANGRDANRWYDWIDSWARFAITPEDLCIPMIAVIGNHECDRNLNEVPDRERGNFRPRERAKFYYSLFPLPEDKSNYFVDFGDYMSIVCLDSYHTQTPESQSQWLEKTLSERSGLPNLFVCYHRPAFGTLVKNDIEEVRQHWTPAIERYGVDAVFEHDHHIYKRTLPLRNGILDPDGVTYVGDGAWGVETRDIPWDRTKKLDYIVRGESKNHLIRVTVAQDYQVFDAFTSDGLPIDNYIRTKTRH